MKITNFKLFIAFLFVLNAPFARAEDYPVKKEKKISKLYNVNTDAGIDIDNKYGNIYVTTWDESQIAIDVVITVEGKTEDKVNKRLDAIDIEFDALKALITAKTVFSSASGSNINMQINYTIKMPRHGSVRLDNQYGNITVDKLLGSSNIECQYGNAIIGALQGDNNIVKLKYSDKSTIGYAKSITVDSQYSGLNLVKAGNTVFKGDYSNLSSLDIESLTYSGDYGEVNVTDIDNFTLRGDYMTLKVGKLNGSLTLKSNYSSLKVATITAKATNIAINSAYTHIEMKYAGDYAFDFDMYLEYTDLQSAGLTFQTKKENGTSAVYKGFYKSSGKNKINIGSEYGSVKLTKI
jgi:hypothetical protein